MKKKLLFKNSTQYSENLYNEFAEFHSAKFSLKYDLFTIFILILLLYCLISTILNGIYFLSIIFAITLFIFGFYRFFGPIKFYEKESTNTSITDTQTFKFYFYDRYFKIRNNSDYDKLSYLKLYKVFETKNFFYLYFNKKYSFVVDKSGFTQGTPEEFSKFIKNKMWLKYSNCNKPN